MYSGTSLYRGVRKTSSGPASQASCILSEIDICSLCSVWDGPPPWYIRFRGISTSIIFIFAIIILCVISITTDSNYMKIFSRVILQICNLQFLTCK
jgi:hypothetical protein